MTNLMRLLSVKTRRRDRISADEEERQRAGHEIVTTHSLRAARGAGRATHQHRSPTTDKSSAP